MFPGIGAAPLKRELLTLISRIIGLSNGSSFIGFIQSGTGAIPRTIQDKAREIFSLKDYATGTGTETTAVQQAISAASVIKVNDLTTFTTGALSSSGKTINWPAGSYSSSLSLVDPLVLSNLSAAPALVFGAGSKHGFSRSFGNLTPNDIYNAIYPSVNNFDVTASVLQVVSGSTIETATAIAGYFRNDAVSPTNPVALFGSGLVTANGGSGWGVNTLLQDAATRTAGAGTGRALVGAEFDFNIMNTGTTVMGASVGGNSLAQPSSSIGFVCNSLGTGIQWTVGFASLDGTVSRAALSIGSSTSASTPNAASQVLEFFWRDGAGTRVQVNQVAGSGYMSFYGAGFLGLSVHSADYYCSTGHGLVVDGACVVSDRKTGYTAMTGSLDKATAYATGTVTLAQLAGRVAQLQADMTSHGLIGA